ncbi:hypothetical protein, partial [Cellulomonas bogoriensis]|uniref:hypothetical protein n=1 Tax=Cellulomonas bogoriensis TaxID=301388 RepID=UPI000554F5D6
MTEQAPAPLTRRELRLAEQAGRARRAPARHQVPTVPLAGGPTAPEVQAWPSRRELRLADKQACKRRRSVVPGPWSWAGAAEAVTPRLAPVAASLVIVGLIGSGAALAQTDHATRVQLQAEQDARHALAEQQQLALVAKERHRVRTS